MENNFEVNAKKWLSSRRSPTSIERF